MENWLGNISSDRKQLLEDNGFDRETFEHLVNLFRRGALDKEANRLDAEIEAPEDSDIDLYPGLVRDADTYREAGETAIRRGEVGLIVLNGGMATRFGGVVKGTVEVDKGRSFIEFKCRDANRFSGDVPVLFMNSFATHESTLEHLENNDYFGLNREQIIPFKQGINLRITPDGDLFRRDGKVSPYAPGHGDLAEHIKKKGALQEFMDRGGKYLLMTNVDNLLATLDPAVIGKHIAETELKGTDMTVEVAKRRPGDKGGLLARVDGEPQIVEYFRFPKNFDRDSLPVFNTNTFLFNADALTNDFDLTWFVVDKQVDGQKAIQFERLAGELSAFLDTSYLLVPSEGQQSRYHPIKRPEDLEQHRDELVSILESRIHD